ncbi:hypothetical protein JCM10213_007129 [Rhodosporidiobolus nylandii]
MREEYIKKAVLVHFIKEEEKKTLDALLPPVALSPLDRQPIYSSSAAGPHLNEAELADAFLRMNFSPPITPPAAPASFA